MTRSPVDQERWGRELRRWPDAELQARMAPVKRKPFEVWRSRDFLVQLFDDDGWIRMTVNRTHMPNGQDWAGGISWDELQALKTQCGRGGSWAVEVYPADGHVVTDANMRHLFLLGEPPPFAWSA